MIHPYRKDTLLFLIVSLFILNTSTNAQTNTYNFNTDDLIIMASPSKNYKDILLQSHNGLPRFGALNMYMISRSQMAPNSKGKSQLIRESYSNYMGLIQMDYMAAAYNDFNRDVLTVASSSDMSKKDQNSVLAQRHFRDLTGNICTTEAGNINAGTNEFERRRNYKNFVANNLDGLREWSSTLLKNNSLTAYWVNTVRLTDYDFDKNGYWMYIPLSTARGRTSHLTPQYLLFKNFSPKTNYENKLPVVQNKRGFTSPLKVLFKISPEKADQLTQVSKSGRGNTITNSTIYMVAKVNVTLKAFSADKNMERPDQPYFEHQFKSPIITLYKDAALTQKVGEISFENLITEN